MGTLETKVIRYHLGKKGFVEDVSGNHIYLHYYVDGKKSSIFTKISHGKKEIGDTLISAMAKQLRLNKAEFMDFAKCKISQTEYHDIVKEFA